MQNINLILYRIMRLTALSQPRKLSYLKKMLIKHRTLEKLKPTNRLLISFLIFLAMLVWVDSRTFEQSSNDNNKDFKCLYTEEGKPQVVLTTHFYPVYSKANIQVKDKEQNILEELYRGHSKQLIGYVYNILRSENEAEEIAQEAFLKLHSAKKPEEIISHKAFLFRIAHNLAMKTLRRRKIVKFDTGINMEEIEVESKEPLADQLLSSKQEFKIFCDAVSLLPPKCQQAFTLRIIHKKSFKEVSQELGIAISTAEKHVLRGMRECQLYVEKAKKQRRNRVSQLKFENRTTKR